MRRRGSCGVAAAVLAVVAATSACSQTPTQQESQVQFCEDMLAFEGAVADLKTLDPADTTVNQVKADLADVGDALAEMKDTAVQLGADRVQDLQQAYDELRSDLQGIDNIQQLQQAAPELKAAGADVAAAFTSLFSSAGCDDQDS